MIEIVLISVLVVPFAMLAGVMVWLLLSMLRYSANHPHPPQPSAKRKPPVLRIVK